MEYRNEHGCPTYEDGMCQQCGRRPGAACALREHMQGLSESFGHRFAKPLSHEAVAAMDAG